MKKRRNDVELTKDNSAAYIGASSQVGGGNGFQRASAEVMANRRVIRTAQARTPVVVAPTAMKTNPFAGVNLVKGGSKPPPTFNPLPPKMKATVTTKAATSTVVPPTPGSVDLNDLVKLVPKIKTSTENLSHMLYMFKHYAKSTTGSTLKSTGTSAVALAPPAPPAFAAFSPPPQQPPATATPTFPAKSAVETVPKQTTVDAGETELMPQEPDEVDGIQDAVDAGWNTIMKIDKAKIMCFDAGQWKVLGIGRLKLLQDEQDSQKYLLSCGNLATRYVNAYVTKHARPALVENTGKPSTATAITLSLPVDNTSKLYNVKAANAAANKLFDELEKIVQSMQEVA